MYLSITSVGLDCACLRCICTCICIARVCVCVYGLLYELEKDLGEAGGMLLKRIDNVEHKDRRRVDSERHVLKYLAELKEGRPHRPLLTVRG